MALKHWLWIGGPVLAASLVAIALLPPRTPTEGNDLFGILVTDPYGHVVGSGRSQFANDVQFARHTQERRLRRATLADSILKVARGPRVLRSEDGLVTLVYEKPLTADSARFWLGAATRELALFPKGSIPGLRLVVALLSDTVREATYVWGVQELVDQATSTGACIVTVNLITRLSWARPSVGHDLAGQPVSRVLGTCALFARFGLPGAGVARWAASELGYSWRDHLTVQLQEARHRVLKFEIPRTLEWNNVPWYGEVRWSEVGCVGGSAALCLRTAGLGGGSDWPYFYSYLSLPRSKVIAYVLATGTPEQFAAFWRSPRAPAEALAGAYGESAGGLAMLALQHWYSTPAPVSPWGNARSALAGLVWAALALALAVAAGRRRKTEI